MATEIQQGNSILRPRARLIKTIGEELISSDIVAVLELVKNSYDADASIIEITFSGTVINEEISRNQTKRVLKKEGGSIKISDDGIGMSLEVIKNAWMEPATIMKKNNKNSPSKNRRYTGEKGIGRFASAKLSKELDIITKVINDNEVKVQFDWSEFSKEEAYLDEVECSWEVREPEEIGVSGTTLKLLNLNSDWDEEKFRLLRVTLSRLINPVAPVEDFLMELRLPHELEDLSGLVDAPDSINKPEYKIRGVVDGFGFALMEYSSRNKKIPECLWKDLSKEIKPIRSPETGPFNFEFRVWDRENDALNRLAKEIGSTRKNIKNDLDDLAGVSIYRDHFRVLPYGDKKNDWLRLNIRRVNNPTLRVSSNQVVGYISISLDSNPEFKDQSNREGLVESQGFTDLQDMIKAILNELEGKRYGERPRKESAQSHESLFNQFSISEVSQLITNKLPKDKEAQAVIKATQSKIEEGIKKVQNVISRYRRLSTLGLLIDVILHDGRNFLLRIDSETRLVQKELRKELPDQKKIENHLNSISEQRKIIAQLFKRLEPFGGRKRGRPKDIVLEKSIMNVIELYNTDLEKFQIIVTFPQTGETNVVRIDEGELQMIFVNLLQNSMHWLQTIDTERKINIEIQKLNDDLEILFSDNGPGVEESKTNLIFDPYFSTKSDGIGLGLTIVGELMEEYNGELQLVDNGPLEGATFKLIFRKRI